MLDVLVTALLVLRWRHLCARAFHHLNAIEPKAMPLGGHWLYRRRHSDQGADALSLLDGYHVPGNRNTVTVVLPPPISGATRLYTPTKPETIATFCLPRAL